MVKKAAIIILILIAIPFALAEIEIIGDDVARVINLEADEPDATISNVSWNESLANSLFWRLDGTNAPPTADWSMGGFNINGSGNGTFGWLFGNLNWSWLQNIPADIADGDNDTLYTNGSGLSLVGTEFNHTDTSSQASSDNSGNTFIQDIILDTFGHITSIVTAGIDLSNVWSALLGNRTEIQADIIANWTDLEARKLNITDQRFNETTTILSVNTTSNIESLGFTQGAHTVDTFVNESGDTMTGNLDMDEVNNITSVSYITFNGTSEGYPRIWSNGTCLITQASATSGKLVVCG